MHKKRNKILKILYKFILVLLFIATLPYYYSAVYRFEETLPFGGTSFYNPYQNTDTTWLKSNFHAHSKMFYGLTHGYNTAEDMHTHYSDLGYDVFSLSNYNTITEVDAATQIITSYEHGINLGAVHQLVLNDEKEFFFDYPLWQNRSHKQFIINRIKKDNNIVAIAHPSFKRGYSDKDFCYLKGYDLIEAISVRKMSLSAWDMALTHGHPVWAIGSDDSHDTLKSHCGVCWNMIHVKEKTKEEIINSIKKGSFYAVKGWMGQEMNRLKKLTVENGHYILTMTHKADTISLYSDHGQKVAEEINTEQIVYEIKPENTYIRAEIFNTEPWNEYTRMYLNPVIRSEKAGGYISSNLVIPQINIPKTILHHLMLFLFHILLLYFVFKK